LNHEERLAAQNALARLKTVTGSLAPGLGASSQSATLIGGALRERGLVSTGLPHGAGSDTFIGGARGSAMSLGNDTVLSGSSAVFDRGTNPLTAHGAGHFSLSSDTINVAGATALSVKAVQPEDKAKSHTVTLGDKTTVTISGLSTHDITKLSH
jgi:hypothetical protein